MARDAGVGTLLLNHVSRRYSAGQVRSEAKAIFPNTIVAEDFDHFEVRRGGAERLDRKRQ